LEKFRGGPAKTYASERTKSGITTGREQGEGELMGGVRVTIPPSRWLPGGKKKVPWDKQWRPEQKKEGQSVCSVVGGEGVREKEGALQTSGTQAYLRKAVTLA